MDKNKPTEKLNVLPPEVQYISTHHVVQVPASDPRLRDPWELRKYAEKILEHRLGDEVQLTSLKVKKPNLMARLKAKLAHIEPQARLFITTKF